MTIRRGLLLLIIAFGVAAPAVAWADDYVGTTTTTATTSTTRPTTTTTAINGTTVTSGNTTTSAINGTTITSGNTSSTVLGTVFTKPTASVLGEVTRRPPALGGLALTGTDILGITAFAAALLAAGLGLVIRARRQTV